MYIFSPWLLDSMAMHQDMLSCFPLLHYGIGLVLCFFGLEMVLQPLVATWQWADGKGFARKMLYVGYAGSVDPFICNDCNVHV